VIEFSDGMKFDISGPYRIEERADGLYVVGGGMLIPIATRDEGDSIIAQFDGGHR
jgi:hypothetical protein